MLLVPQVAEEDARKAGWGKLLKSEHIYTNFEKESNEKQMEGKYKKPTKNAMEGGENTVRKADKQIF